MPAPAKRALSIKGWQLDIKRGDDGAVTLTVGHGGFPLMLQLDPDKARAIGSFLLDDDLAVAAEAALWNG
jgi:hypothetical protein